MEDDVDMYILAFYFILTTISTVGYGDLGPSNRYERMFCMAVMIVGVSGFSFVSGALASIMSSYDSQEAELSEKYLQLNKLRALYHIPPELYQEIRSSLKFGFR